MEKHVFYETKLLKICSNEYVKIRGKLLEYPLIGNGFSTILMEAVLTGNKEDTDNKKFVIKIIVQGDLRHFFKGDTLEIDTLIKRSRPSVNFFAPQSESYQLVNGIHFSGYSKSAQFAEKREHSNFLLQVTGKMREKIRSLIEKRYLSKNGTLSKEGQMLEALLLGDRGRLDPQVKEMLLRTGIFHLFAISGAHIGIIALFTMLLLKRTHLKMRKKYQILIFVLLFFLLLTGFKVSAQRAVLMAVLISLSKILYLRSDMMNIISFSGLILLLRNPRCFLDPGFILTFTITAGIVSGRRIFFTDGTEKSSYIKEMTAANFNASIISIPLSLFYFMRYSFTGFLAGPALLPAAAIIMCLSLPLIPISILPSFLAPPFLILPDIFLKSFFFLAESFSEKIDLTIFRAPPPFLLLLLSLILFFLLSRTGNNKIIKTLSIFLMGITITGMVIKPPPHNPRFPEVYFLDVGQGDSHIVVFPGGDSLLIDGGGSGFGDFETGKQIVLPFILRQNIKIKWISVSHYHPDHCKGINEIIAILRPDEIWLSSFPDVNQLYDALTTKSRGITRIRKVTSGFNIKRGKAKIELIYPDKTIYPFRTKNDHSQVIRLSNENIKVLFTGDIESAGENTLVRKFGKGLKSNILKVPHHGSATSSSPLFLEMTDPDIAVFPLGYRNSFGFPHKDVRQRYESMNVRTLFTSEHGGILAILDPDGIVLRISRFAATRNVKY